MKLVEALLDTSYADTQLLIKNDELGDSFAIVRDVDFVFLAEEKSKAEIVASFVNDNRYGVPRVEETDEGFRLVVTIEMPTTQNLLCSVSALMVCLAELFSIQYDGWGSTLKISKSAAMPKG